MPGALLVPGAGVVSPWTVSAGTTAPRPVGSGMAPPPALPPGRRSPLVLVTAAGSLAVLAAVVQTPGLSRFFGCTPLDPLAWLVVLGCAAAGTAGAEVLPRLTGGKTGG